MKDTIYFTHDYNSRNDSKIIKLRMKYGWEGFGLFWATIEILREQSNGMQTHSDCIANAFQLHYDNAKYSEFIEYCLSIELFKKDKRDNIYSSRLLEDMEYMHEKSKSASKSAKKRWQLEREKKQGENANALPTDMQTHSEGNAKEEKEDSIIEEKSEYRPLTEHHKPFAEIQKEQQPQITNEYSLRANTVESESWIKGMAESKKISKEAVIKKMEGFITERILNGDLDKWGHASVQKYILKDWDDLPKINTNIQTQSRPQPPRRSYE